MKLSSLGFVATLLVVACSGSKEPVSILQGEFIFPVVIYPLGSETIDNAAITRKALEILPNFRYYDRQPDSVTSDGYQVIVTNSADSSFIPPQVFLVAEEYLLMTRAELDDMAKVDRNVQIVFFGTTDKLMEKQAQIAKFIGEVTRNKKVGVVDFSSRQVFNPEAWQSVRTESFQKQPLNINDHIVFHIYREEAYCRIVSLGMSKFGLPELSMNNVTCSDQRPFGIIMNGLVQSMFETQSINSDSTITLEVSQIKNSAVRDMFASNAEVEGGTGKAKMKLRGVPPQEGDNYYYQLEVVFVDKSFASEQEERMAIATALLGAVPDVASETDHDEELLAASERARLRLPELKKMFNEGLPPGASMIVKSPFARQDVNGNEWMWVEVTKWTDDTMEGILQNDPSYIKDLVNGSAVTIEESEIFDYILYNADGSMEGNETGKILEQRMGNH